MQFRGQMDFSFNGCNFLDWKLVGIGEDKYFDFIQGQRISVETTDGINGESVFKSIKKENLELDFYISKLDGNLNCVKTTKDDLFEINRLLQQNKPSCLVVGGYEYYGIFTSLESYYNGQNIGYIKCSFKMTVPYAYSLSKIHNARIRGERVLEIYNKSSVNDLIQPQIIFELRSGDKIKFTNLRNGQVCEFNGLNVNNEYMVINEYSCNNDNPSEIVFPTNGDYIRLGYGKNPIKIECENGEVQIIFKSKLGFM